MVTFSQAFDLTTMTMALCWQMECTMIWVWIRRSKECNLPHWIAADISRHQWTCNITYFKGFVWNPSVLHCVAVLQLVGQAWQPLFQLFAWNIICDALIYWSCSDDWQQGKASCNKIVLQPYHNYIPNGYLQKKKKVNAQVFSHLSFVWRHRGQRQLRPWHRVQV